MRTASRASQRTTVPTASGGEIGVSQFVQARAARTTPTTDCNPVLLKPRGDGERAKVVQGEAHEHVPAGTYYDEYWERAREAAEESYRRLAADNDVIVAEGAGSIGEINLHDRDLANVETARFADADILLLVDIERGGAFASLYGTIELVPDALRERIVGALITKFRGDPSLLEPGIEEIESKTGVPDSRRPALRRSRPPEEDSVGPPGAKNGGVVGDDDGVPAERRIRIAVPRLPRISNATDLEALAAEPGVSVVYVPVDGDTADPLEGVDADAVVLPGTKNTVDDLLALHDAGFADALAAFEGPIVGVCGGYQLLGERITNAALEGTGEADVVEGLGLLPVETRFEGDKRLEHDGSRRRGRIAAARGSHGSRVGLRDSRRSDPRARGCDPTARGLECGQGRVLGTYLHGLFDNASVRTTFLDTVAASAGSTGTPRTRQGGEEPGETPADRAARLVRDHVELVALGEPFERLE